MPPRSLHFIVPGDIETRTGGYGYDRRIVAGLRSRGWTVHLASLPGAYPAPSSDERRAAADVLASVPDGGWAIVDGLAFGVLADEVLRERSRLHLIALVHHPLGLETGIDARTAERLLASERLALSAARGVVVTSRRTVGAVETLGAPLARIAVVEPGTDPAPMSDPVGYGAVRLLCVASLVPRKGYDTLFDALERIAGLKWHLTCVGSPDRDPAYAAALQRRCATPPLARRVTLAGELSGATLEAAYRSADLFVLPTRYEGYGMAVAEALARAVPVIGTPTGAIAELVGDTAGILVPPDDAAALAQALESVINHPARLAGLRAGALVVRPTLPTWDTVSARMEEALLRFGAR